MTAPRPLDDDHRKRAREMAEAQVPDSVILEALQADVYEATTDPRMRAMMLAGLQALDPADALELRKFRGRGRAWMQLALYACAMGYALNARKERFRPEEWPEGTDPVEEGYRRIAPVEASALQYVFRNLVAIDPNALTEDAQKEAQAILDGGEEQAGMLLLQVARTVGVPRPAIDAIEEWLGVESSDAGEAVPA